jgi:aryl-alcohol dehydrogenase-like predicted oxidoreductase
MNSFFEIEFFNSNTCTMKYKLLGTSGLRVSEICLGTMTFGEEWGWGANAEESKKIFYAYLEQGGNFIDTANRYTEGTSEKLLGAFIKESKQRKDIVLATKYSLITDKSAGINQSGNHKKNMIQSVEDSLQRLQTEYIDLFYLHAWDFTTSAEEVLRAMDDLVRQGKILYVGISDTPAWIVSRANAIAEYKNWTAFQALQIEYSLLQRTVERELLPMAEALEMSVIAWAPIAGGALTGKYLQEETKSNRLSEKSVRLSASKQVITKEVVRIAEEMHCSPAQVAIAWVLQKGNHIIPIAGARNADQLMNNINAASVKISNEHMRQLDEISTIELGFPHEFLKGEGVQDILFASKGGQLLTGKKRC